uniref:AAA+ ATPase domain-containing protein n=1 Tax=Ananas comosus var. bracteatus TaxID=296719 RepID=A0A6V7NXF1_ANACO|nr:unnamed protein product [Ananas comosus var. bracteatus]
MVFTSRKVFKNSVRLSWGLSCAIGLPSLGRLVFICPLALSQPTDKLDSSTNLLTVHACNDLYLNLIPVKFRSSIIASSDPASPPVGKGNAIASRRLLQNHHTRAGPMILYRMQILRGNIVVITVLGQHCVFLVEGVEFALAEQGSTSAKDSSCYQEIKISSNSGQGLDIFVVDARTKVHFSGSSFLDGGESTKIGLPLGHVSYYHIIDEQAGDVPRLGGLSKEFVALKEIISSSVKSDNALRRFKGVLLHGPPGTGKTSLAISCAHEAGAKLFSINGSEIMTQYYGESEQALCDVFYSARLAAPAVVFIDEFDAIALSREDGGEDLSSRMVVTLSQLMDEIKRIDHLLVIAATNRPDSIDPALRRPGRLDQEIEIGVPSPEQRFEILCTILSSKAHSLSNAEIQSLALAAHGFVGADLAALCNEAAMNALRRYIRSKRENHGNSFMQLEKVAGKQPSGVEKQIDYLSLPLSKCSVSCGADEMKEETQLKVTIGDFKKAKMKVRPSSMREVKFELPYVCWEDVGGQTKVKKQLIEAVQWPQINPELFECLGVSPPRGLLMIGPPGCSKTLMARAVASEAKLNFLAVKGPELFSKWVGDSEKAVRSLFAKARANAPAIIFFDEIDGLAVTRGRENDSISVADRVVSQLLVEMDGLDRRVGITVIAATNRPDKIDHALLRPGRFDLLLNVHPPDEVDREEIFGIHMRSMPRAIDVDIKELANLAEGYTGADIKLVCREAGIAALEESLDISEASMRHFKIALSRVQPSNVQFYEELAAQFERFVDDGSI